MSFAAASAIAGLTAARPAAASPTIMTAWAGAYPSSTLPARMSAATGSSCNLCHHPPARNTPGNCYRSALAARIALGRTEAEAIADIGAEDSDGDGVSNHDEILAARTDLPGHVGYNPGLIGATGTDPCSLEPIKAVSSALETPPPPSCRADFNHSGAASVQDIFDFLAAYFAGESRTDINGANGLSVQDIFDFLALYFADC
jgi:cytochrome c5